MPAENDRTHRISACSVEVSPSEVDAGADMRLKAKVSCWPAADLRGRPVLIHDKDEALAGSIELTEFDGEVNQTSELLVKAPVRPRTYTWLAVCPAHAEAGISYEESSAPFSFTVKPHRTRVVVWGTPSAIECGEAFRIKLGVKCSSECQPEGWLVEVLDHNGRRQATVTLGADRWPGAAALYYTEVELRAPGTEGLYTWSAKAPAAGLDVPHADCIAAFGVRAVPTPECLLTVLAIDVETQSPVEGAKVVVHPYRAFTDDRGVAKLRVPKGEYRLFVSGGDYSPFRSNGEVRSDMTIRAELALDEGLSDADIWS